MRLVRNLGNALQIAAILAAVAVMCFVAGGVAALVTDGGAKCPAQRLQTTSAPDGVTKEHNGVTYFDNPQVFGGGWLSWPEQGDVGKYKVVELWAEGWPHPRRQPVDKYMPPYPHVRLWWRPVCG